MTAPDAPVPSNTPGDQALLVTWAAVTADPVVTGYMVKKGSGAWASVGLALSKAYTGLPNGKAVTVQVAAVNEDGQGAPGTTTGTPVDDGDTSNDNGFDDTTIFANPGLAVQNLDFNDPDD